MRFAQVLGLTLLLTVLLFSVAEESHAAPPLYVAVNDTLPDLTVQTAPISVSGVTYIPYTIFGRSTTGVSLGVFYDWSNGSESLSLYSSSEMLRFDIAGGTARSNSSGEEYAYRAVMRNGIPYVPAAPVCSFFGLSSSLLYSSDQAFQLLRIKNGDAILSDDMFMRSVHSILVQNSSETPTPSALAPEEEEEILQTPLGIRLAIAVHDPTAGHALLDQFRADTEAIFFFDEASIAVGGDLLRRAVSEGHSIGLIASGTTEAERLESLARCNHLLSYLLRYETPMVLAEGLSTEEAQLLEASGYLLHRVDAVFSGDDYGNTGLQNAVAAMLLEEEQGVRLLFDTAMSGSTLRALLQTWATDQHWLLSTTETSF